MFEIESQWIYGKNKNWKTRYEKKTKNRIPVISGITINNGVNYYTEDIPDDMEIFSDSLTISTRGEYSGTVTYHDGKFVLANNILVMSMPNYSKKQKLFIGSIINNLGYGGYNNYPRKELLKNDYIKLPTKNGKIDFEFMENFVAELEAQRVAELEAYLIVTGLKNYELTSDEKIALESLDNINWKEYKLVDVFDVKNTKNILSNQVIFDSGKIPYLCASSANNSIASYINYKEEMIDKGNCIFIGGKTFVVSYQEKDFYSNDSHNLALYLKNNKITKKNHLFMISCIVKSLSYKYSWGNSISNKKIQNDLFLLPIKNDKIDFCFMETLISAIQKLVIKDVVLYADKKIELTKKVIKK